MRLTWIWSTICEPVWTGLPEGAVHAAANETGRVASCRYENELTGCSILGHRSLNFHH